MGRIRKQHSPEFKLKAVVEILKGEKTATQLAGELEVHPVVLSDWKATALESAWMANRIYTLLPNIFGMVVLHLNPIKTHNIVSPYSKNQEEDI
jgi:hypothetical protein